MAKGYWIARIDVTAPELFATYAAGNRPIFSQFGARPLVLGGKFQSPEGTSRSRNIVIEFPDYAAALACYHSPAYEENRKRQFASAVTDLIVVEGL